ncbi:MAG: DASS family sodium-coupled anion symporter [Deferribacteraceae bacterium]|jgi:sodium-dependent dicarboxylate transporter 2/3/5|nr:DASS family sodium-coupled anion symporter [Deferribacteraceae bacterium]
MLDGKKIGLLLGPAIFILMLVLPAPEGLTPAAWKVAAMTVLMAIWWITEALPLAATALIPMVLYPVFGIMSSGATTASYGDQVIYLFMGGFFLAVAMERWNLHRRVALYTIRLVGTTPSHMILGFMVATGLLSMWISNTACAVMMVPIGIAVVSQITGITRQEVLDEQIKVNESNFAKSLMLGIAYAASLGGVATIIGTPPNTIMVGMLERMYGMQISFAAWMAIGVPISVVMIAIVWFLLTKVLFRTGDLKLMGGKELIEKEIDKLGPMSRPEKTVLIIGCTMAICWIVRGFLNVPALKMVSDTTIAIAGSLALFIAPANFKENHPILDWKTAVKIPWDIVLLFGGGITIASGFEKTGLAAWISSQLTALDGVNMLIFVLVVTALVVFLTEVTSNTATATLLVPIMGSAAIAMGIHPYATIVPACVAASFAFMLPVATPPNAVIFGSGYVRIKDMAYAGFLLNLVGILAITATVVWLVPMFWGIDLATTPPEIAEKAAAAAAALK